MRSAPNSPNVWPGYVAAVAGLAITLLLVIAILGGDLFLVSQAVRQELRQIDSEADPPPNAALADASPQVVDTAAPILVPRDPSASASAWKAATSPASVPKPRAPDPATSGGRIALLFDEDAHALNDEIRASLRTALSPLPARQSLRLTARLPGDASAAARRAAFIRIMAVRNALLELDIAADRIQFQLLDADVPSDAEWNPRTIVIEAAAPSSEGERHAR
ncbi:hypothetical protein ACQ86G_14435 [Roseateles chitinivorans]|uniref:hypothetical protein n=1 Tax=Roseateles chitinivorans TaxID=2917965 RepID=UPI003D679FDC